MRQFAARFKLASPRKKVDPHEALKLQTTAFETLEAPEYCSLHNAQLEHAMAACHRAFELRKEDVLKKWMEAARCAFELHYGSHPGVFELYAKERGMAQLFAQYSTK
mmetsp:Transcript_1170/g.4069  ORF Transcript_1170/g.4069 Transcript_1170/m.4069 type:complete len:107 (+) Transcript_1170:738-1058(+)